MYLFFFPRNRVKVVFALLFFVRFATIGAVWVIGMWFLIELISSGMQNARGIQTGVAHLAHSGGFVVGAVLAALLTTLGLVENDGNSLWAVLTGRAGPRHVYDEDVSDANYQLERSPHAAPVNVPDERGTIVALLHAGRIDEARRAWRRYAFDNHEGVLPVREQLEVALAMDKHGERGIARDAYERLIKSYPTAQPFAAEANLALAGMLLQELNESGNTHEVPLIQGLLRQAASTHPQQTRRALAEKWLSALA